MSVHNISVTCINIQTLATGTSTVRLAVEVTAGDTNPTDHEDVVGPLRPRGNTSDTQAARHPPAKLLRSGA